MRLYHIIGLLSGAFIYFMTAQGLLGQLNEKDLLEIEEELKAPILLHLKNGRYISGHALDVSDGKLRIASAEGAGEITFTFTKDEILKIEVPGDIYKSRALQHAENGDSLAALQTMERLYKQRSKLLPILDPAEAHYFIYYVDLVLDSPNPARSIAIIQRLSPVITHPDAKAALEGTILESYNTLQLHEEALPYAQAWVESRSPFGDSALGFYVLGTHHLRLEEYTEALDLALQPIVFSTPTPQDKLAHCYAVAISAALGLREKDYAHTLLSEMREQDLLWPEDDPTFEPFFKKLNPPDDNQ